jgi:hypothetical protein
MIDIKFSDSQYLSLSGAAHAMPAVYDLDMKILVSKGDEEFILSDTPVIRCNQFAEFHPHFSKFKMGTRGLAQKGIQLFMPVSPGICLALYDPTTYQYGSPKRPITVIGNGDLKLLNRLQALGADTCLYQSISGPGHDELCKYADFRETMMHEKKPTVQRSQEKQRPDGKMSQIIMTSTEKFLTGRKFSFATVIDKSDYSRHVTVPIRSKELGENIKKHRDELDRREAEMKKRTD